MSLNLNANILFLNVLHHNYPEFADRICPYCNDNDDLAYRMYKEVY